MSGGSQPEGTSLPIITNPRFNNRTISIDATGTFIKPGAVLKVDDRDSFPLKLDATGTRLMVPQDATGSSSGLTLNKLLKRGKAARLVVMNPDGKLSVGLIFTRN